MDDSYRFIGVTSDTCSHSKLKELHGLKGNQGFGAQSAVLAVNPADPYGT